MSRSFKVSEVDVQGGQTKETRYKGFDKDFSGIGPDHLFVCLIEGEIEVFAADSRNKTSQFFEYLVEQEDQDPNNPRVKILGCYSR